MEQAVPGLRVYKFGGASVKDAAGILNLVRIVRDTAQGQPLLVVVSAMGKTTNALEEIYDLAWRGQDYSAQLTALEAYHIQTAREVSDNFADAEAAVQRERLGTLLIGLAGDLLEVQPGSDYDEGYDQIISYGERLSAFLVSFTLARLLAQQEVRHVPATSLLQTAATWREGKVNWPATESWTRQIVNELLLAGKQILITEGFIGGTSVGATPRTTTLGREGSDYSAAIFAYCLGAESVTIWKDVPGLLNADPKIFADTVLYPEISYQETIEMAYYGASVIHPKTLQPLAERKIPLYVKSFVDPAAPGTVIHDCQHPALAPAFIRKGGQCLLSFQSKDFAFISEENLAVIFGALAGARLKINLLQSSAISFSVATDYHEGRVRGLLAGLGGQFRIQYNAGLTLFTIKNYDEASIGRLTAGRELLLEQRTRSTFQFLVRE